MLEQAALTLAKRTLPRTSAQRAFQKSPNRNIKTYSKSIFFRRRKVYPYVSVQAILYFVTELTMDFWPPIRSVAAFRRELRCKDAAFERFRQSNLPCRS